MDQRKFWHGDVPTQCDACQAPITVEFVDGATARGWGNFCIPCHKRHGHGLGLGRGQHYVLQGDKFWKQPYPGTQAEADRPKLDTANDVNGRTEFVDSPIEIDNG